jgi:hypothetical protein
MPSRSPNIVLLLMDNLGWGEPGVYGGELLRGLSANAVILSDADHSASRQTNGKMDGPPFPPRQLRAGFGCRFRFQSRRGSGALLYARFHRAKVALRLSLQWRRIRG